MVAIRGLGQKNIRSIRYFSGDGAGRQGGVSQAAQRAALQYPAAMPAHIDTSDPKYKTAAAEDSSR